MKKTSVKNLPNTDNIPFVSASVMMGAVTETDALRQTVYGIANSDCRDDIAEILIAYPEDRITPECMAVLRELGNSDIGVKLDIFPQKTKGIGYFSDTIERATGSHCIVFQSDMAMSLDIIGRLIDETKKGGREIVTTSRWMRGGKFSGYNRAKLIVNFASQLFLRVLYGGGLTDYTNPVQLMPSKIYKSIKWEENDFSRYLELQVKPLRLGCCFREIPTDCTERTEGETSNGRGELIHYLKTAIHIRFMKKEDMVK